jgi:RsmE family RNA methyltransferase
MNLILLSEDDFIDHMNLAQIKGRRLAHVLTIHRAGVGDTLRVGVINGRMGTGTVIRLDANVLVLQVDVFQSPPPPLDVILLLALPRPKMLKRIVMAVSSMGVKRIVLFHSCRVEKSFWQSPLLQKEALDDNLKLGLEQAMDTVLPKIHLRRRFKPFVEDELPLLIQGHQALVAHPAAFESCPRHARGPVCLAIGPEGGWVSYEIEKLIQCGFQPVHMGPRILRVETAVTALLARLF